MRGECVADDAVRPCPYVSCRYHLAGEMTDHRMGPRWAPNTRTNKALTLEDYSCTLDVVDEHPSGLTRQETAWLLGLSADRIMQIEAHALRRLYAADLSPKRLREAHQGLAALRDEYDDG